MYNIQILKTREDYNIIFNTKNTKEYCCNETHSILDYFEAEYNWRKVQIFSRNYRW